MPLKPCVQHLISKPGILPLSTMSPMPPLPSKEERANPRPQTLARKGVRSQKPQPQGALGLAPAPAWNPAGWRSPCSGPRCSPRIWEEKPAAGRRAKAGAAPRWLLCGSELGPGSGPTRAPAPPRSSPPRIPPRVPRP